MNDELEAVWKEAIVAFFKAVTTCLEHLSRTTKNL